MHLMRVFGNVEGPLDLLLVWITPAFRDMYWTRGSGDTGHALMLKGPEAT